MKLFHERGERIFKGLLLGLLALAIIASASLSFFDGIYSSGRLAILGMLAWLTIWALCFLCLAVTIFCLVKRRPALKFSIAWILLAILNYAALSPAIVLIKAGAIYRVHQIGSDEVVKEGQELIQKYKDSSNETNEYEIVNYPPAIKRLHPIYVEVYGRQLEIKKEGMGDWAGFIITLDKNTTDGRALAGQKICDYFYWYDDRSQIKNAP